MLNRSDRTYRVDMNMVDAMEVWFDFGIHPGTCCEYLLRGDYERAWYSAHEMIREQDLWNELCDFVEDRVPEICRGENYDKWKGYDDYLFRKRCRQQIGEELDEVGEIFRIE